MIWALVSEDVAFMVVVVAVKWVFGAICPMLNFLTCHMTTPVSLVEFPSLGEPERSGLYPPMHRQQNCSNALTLKMHPYLTNHVEPARGIHIAGKGRCTAFQLSSDRLII